MNTLPLPEVPGRSRPYRALLALTLALVATAGFALESGEGRQARGPTGGQTGGQAGKPLVVSVDYVVPEYKAGAKFRSSATIDAALAEDLARRLQLPLAMVDAAEAGPRQADLRLTTLADVRAVPPALAVVPVDYRSAPMAIMRSDSSIRRWEQLAGRKVCVAKGGNQVGMAAGRYGAVETVYPSPTDALIALRVGDCDAMVHDSVMLEELLRYPEWKKFSRRLNSSDRSMLAILVPAEDEASLSAVKRIAADWRAKAYPASLVKNAMRNIAFEVYLDQEVPDCH